MEKRKRDNLVLQKVSNAGSDIAILFTHAVSGDAFALVNSAGNNHNLLAAGTGSPPPFINL